jgi:hypothetical protein
MTDQSRARSGGGSGASRARRSGVSGAGTGTRDNCLRVPLAAPLTPLRSVRGADGVTEEVTL